MMYVDDATPIISRMLATSVRRCSRSSGSVASASRVLGDAAVSSSRRRMIRPTGITRMPITNASRQPHDSSAEGASTLLSSKPTSAPNSAASPWLNGCQLV